MTVHLSAEQLEALRQIDSPTVANAIEAFGVRPATEGYVGYDIACAFPQLGTMLGYAVTCTADSTTEDRPGGREGLLRLWETLEAAPKPAVVVIKDVGTNRLHSCHMGEVMATTAKRLGAVGAVSDGGLRDVMEVQALGFQYFCPGFVVSHGHPLILESGMEVEISGLRIKPGDLLHGDVNGLVAIPDTVADRVAAEVEKVRIRERELMDFVLAPGFTVAKLRDRLFSH
ncbi:MAG: RraA family protein [Anaerolineae bacterium]